MTTVVVKRRALLVLLIVSGAMLPLACVSALFAFNAVNPTQLAFLVSVRVENRLDQGIWVTPIGACGPQGHRRVLPQYLCRFPAIPPLRDRNMQVRAGAARTIHYDWDDINFSEILIRTAEWERVLVVDPEPTVDRYHSPRKTAFVIDRATVLTEPSAQILEAMRRPGPARQWIVAIAGLAVLAVFVYSLRRYRRILRLPSEVVV